MILLVAILVLLIGLIPGSLAQAQTEPPVYFPIFMTYQDPDYAYGLDGGTVENVIVDPNNSNIVYAGTWGNGIYKWDDDIGAWTHIADGLRSAYIYEIAIDPFDSNHLLASVYEHGIDQSFDGGQTWAAVSGFPEYAVAYSIDFDPVNSQNVYAAIRVETIYDSYGNAVWWPGGVWKSIDGGSNWEEKSNGITEDYIYDLAIDPRNPQVIYTANHKTGVFRTTDGGENWVKKSNGLVHQDIRGIQVNPVNGRVYAGLWDSYGFAYSTNNGDSWVNNGWSNSQDLYVYEIQYDPYQPSNVYLTTSNGVYFCVSPSSGSSCSLMANSGRFVFDLALDLNASAATNGRTGVLYTGLQHFGLHKSDDGGAKFVAEYEGIRANIIKAVMVDPSNPNLQFASSSNRGLFRTRDGGVTWQPLHDVLSLNQINEIVIDPLAFDIVYIADKYGGIKYTLNEGDTWGSVNSGFIRSESSDEIGTDPTGSPNAIDPSDYEWMDPVDLQDLIDAVGSIETDRASAANVSTIGFDPSDPTLMFAGKNSGGVLYTNNSGANWYQSNLTSGNVLDSLVDPSQSQKFLIGMENGGVKASSDRVNWQNMNDGWSGRDVFGLALQSPGVYLAGTDNGVYRYDGSSWAPISPSLPVRDLVVDPTVPLMVWAATWDGLYYGTATNPDGPYEWTKFDLVDSNNEHMYVIEVIPGAREFYIGMDGGDLYHLTEDLLP
jgi:photosystem II stability/assembly factor-like uncharacterized protein